MSKKHLKTSFHLQILRKEKKIKRKNVKNFNNLHLKKSTCLTNEL